MFGGGHQALVPMSTLPPTLDRRRMMLVAEPSLKNRLLLIGLLLGLLTTVAVSREPLATSPDVLLIDDFEGDVRNQLGGLRNSFVRAPSSVKAKRVYGDAQGPDGLCAKITARQQGDGFCGYWVQFVDRRETAPNYVDATNWQSLSFRIRGQVGGEDLLIKLADEDWLLKEDSIAIGSVSEFLPGSVSTTWQEVVIPFSNIKPLNLQRLAAISFKCESTSEQTVFIDDLHLKRRADSKLPRSSQAILREPKTPAPDKAMWVWSTEQVLKSATETRDLFAACERDRIQRLWMQAVYDRVASPGNEPARCVLRHTAELRQFLKAAHQRGIAVEALDGFPEFALREQHSKLLGLVDAICAFNEQSAADSRFDGMHFDNEPYVILGWSDPQLREEILQDFLTLNVECQRRARAAGLAFGVDIPFWWQSKSSPQAEPAGVVTFRGVRKPASHHCIDLLDNVGIMNYRDTADGADGMLMHGRELLTYSDSVPNARVYLGVETFIEAPSTAHLIVGLPVAEFRAALRDRGREFARLSRLHDFRICRLEDGERVHVGLVLPEKLSTEERRLADQSLLELARAFGRLRSSRDDDAILKRVAEAVEKDSEWQGFRRSDLRDAELEVTYLGFQSTQVMPSKVTFGDDSLADLTEEVDFAERGFRQHRSYSGIAVHSWESYRKLK